MNSDQWQTAPPQPIKRRVVVQQAGVSTHIEPLIAPIVIPIEWPVDEPLNPCITYRAVQYARGPPVLSVVQVQDRCVIHGGFLLEVAA